MDGDVIARRLGPHRQRAPYPASRAGDQRPAARGAGRWLPIAQSGRPNSMVFSAMKTTRKAAIIRIADMSDLGENSCSNAALATPGPYRKAARM